MDASFFLIIIACGIMGFLTFVLSSGGVVMANFLRKLKLVAVGAVHMCASKDKKLKVTLDAQKVQVDRASKGKRIIFIRHGESEWNEVFNRGFGLGFFVRLTKAFIREVMMLTSRDSVFFDSPLSDTGIRQAQELVKFLHKPPAKGFESPEVSEAVAVLRGEGSGTVVLATSNLRRAIATGLIALWERLRRGEERLLVLSNLQEMTFNVDGISLLEPGETPDTTLAKELGGEVTFDAEFNKGTKGLDNTGMRRMSEFCEWASRRQEDTVVCLGHSLYFRSYFRTFLPQACIHKAKSKKIVNCGIVAFTLHRGAYAGRAAYLIDPDSITTVYGGFK
ncbi:unnamed protein product [Discosporangium mesarthrocarpum]